MLHIAGIPSQRRWQIFGARLRKEDQQSNETPVPFDYQPASKRGMPVRMASKGEEDLSVDSSP